MFCPRCGQTVTEGASSCSSCGYPVQAAGAPTAAPGQPTMVPGGPPMPSHTSGKAVTSLILGLLSFSFLTAIPAVVLGHLALSEIKKSAGQIGGHGIAIAGLVLGYLGVAMLPFILIIAAIAIPNLLRARMAANEASAVSSIRTLTTAEISYASFHERAGYTCSLADLQSAGLLTAPLANGTKNGYVFVLQNCAADTRGGPISKYQVIAYPASPGQSGRRSFCSDESATVKANVGGPENCLANGSEL
jgi:type IV pilus assembly protein PilA